MRSSLFLIALFNLFKLASGQTAVETFEFAENQFELGNRESALRAYERLLYFDPSGNYTAEVYQRIGQCYLNNGEYSNAANYFDLAYNLSTESLKPALVLDKAYSLILDGKPKFALIELYSLPPTLSPDLERNAHLISGSAEFLVEEFETARDHFLSLAENEADSVFVLKQFKLNDKVSKINPQRAKTLSLILPGLGQFYLGDVKNGLNSLILVGGLIYLAVRVANIYGIVDALLAVLPYAQRYYTGGFQRAGELAKGKIMDGRAEIHKELINYFGSKI